VGHAAVAPGEDGSRRPALRCSGHADARGRERTRYSHESIPINNTKSESNALTFLTAGGNDIKQMLENPPKVRPNLTGGDETTALTVLIVCKG